MERDMPSDGTNGIDPAALVTVFSRRLSRHVQTSLCFLGVSSIHTS